MNYSRERCEGEKLLYDARGPLLLNNNKPALNNGDKVLYDHFAAHFQPQ